MSAPRPAAFFDVDGTIVGATIVHYYMYLRRRLLPRWAAPLWSAAYLAKCVGYLIIDKVDRARFNVVFYRDYGGLDAARVKGLAHDVYRDVMAPRVFEGARACIAEHRQAGRDVVLATGSLDFLMRPLAEAVGAAGVVCPRLIESNGRLTGALDGPPVSDAEKARRLREFAARNGYDLAASYAYGDSVADVPMLEAVGHPHAVNPGKTLSRLALERGWAVCHWRGA